MKQQIDRVEVCLECGMMYMKGLEKDEKTHRKAHGLAVEGVPVSKDVLFKTTLFRQQNVQLVQVSHNHGRKKEKQLAEQVSIVAKRATERRQTFTWFRYDTAMPANEFDYRLSLYQIDNRIVGMAALCKREGSIYTTWSGDQGIEDKEQRWCVEMVWVASNWRKQGIARVMLTETASHLSTTPDLFAWSSPFTDSGKALVQSFCSNGFFYR